MSNFSKKLYRNGRRGLAMGVCAGIAEYLTVDVKFVRILTLIAVLFTGFFPIVIIYAILGVALDDVREVTGRHRHDL